MRFGDYLRQERAERGWTQPQAAARARIEQSYLSKLENNKSIPSSDIYARLVEAYGIDAEEMAGVLFPAELDRLREIDALRELLLQRSRADIETPRRILITGLVALIVGGGFLGFSQLEPARMVTQYTYQSTGVIAANDPADTAIPPSAPGEDEQTKFLTQLRGPTFTEEVPGGRRVWNLAGSDEVLRAPPFRWALIPGIALIIGGLGCFFVAWRWR